MNDALNEIRFNHAKWQMGYGINVLGVNTDYGQDTEKWLPRRIIRRCPSEEQPRMPGVAFPEKPPFWRPTPIRPRSDFCEPMGLRPRFFREIRADKMRQIVKENRVFFEHVYRNDRKLAGELLEKMYLAGQEGP